MFLSKIRPTRKLRNLAILTCIVIGIILIFLFINRREYSSSLIRDRHGNDNFHNNNDEYHDGDLAKQVGENGGGGGDGGHDVLNPNEQQQQNDVGAEIGNSLYDQRLKYVTKICQDAFPSVLMRNALNSGGGRSVPMALQRAINNRDNDPLHSNSNPLFTKKKKVIYFIGDSHALRAFRWTTMFLRLANFLKPASEHFVAQFTIHSMNLGVFHDKARIEMQLIPNPSRLQSIEFRRGVFIEDAMSIMKEITEQTRKERNFEAIIYMSVGSWDFLRSTVDRQGFSFETMFPKVKSRLDAPHQIGNEHLITEDEANTAFRQHIGKRWRDNCEKMNTEIVNAFAWGEDLDEDHHLRRLTSNGGIVSRVAWRFPGSPNCTSSRFHPPRASVELESACNLLTDTWWDEFRTIARDMVQPHEKKPVHRKSHGDEDASLKSQFNFHYERRNLPECNEKVDGIHPDNFCMAKEAGSFLLRVLSS